MTKSVVPPRALMMTPRLPSLVSEPTKRSLVPLGPIAVPEKEVAIRTLEHIGPLKKTDGIPYVYHRLTSVDQRTRRLGGREKCGDRMERPKDGGAVHAAPSRARPGGPDVSGAGGRGCGQDGRNGKKRWPGCNGSLPRRLAVGGSPGLSNAGLGPPDKLAAIGVCP